MILAVDTVVNQDCKVEFEYALGAGSTTWYPIMPYNQVDLGIWYDNVLHDPDRAVKVRGRMILGSSKTSPIISYKRTRDVAILDLETVITRMFFRKWLNVYSSAGYPDDTTYGSYTHELIDGVDDFSMIRVDFKSNLLLTIKGGDGRQVWPVAVVRDPGLEARVDDGEQYYRYIDGTLVTGYPEAVTDEFYHYMFQLPLRCVPPDITFVVSDQDTSGIGNLPLDTYDYAFTLLTARGESQLSDVIPITVTAPNNAPTLEIDNGITAGYALDPNASQIKFYRKLSGATAWESCDDWVYDLYPEAGALSTGKHYPTTPGRGFSSWPKTNGIVPGVTFLFIDTKNDADDIDFAHNTLPSVNEAGWGSDEVKIMLLLGGSGPDGSGIKAALVPKVREFSAIMGDTIPFE
jgi:hypothetical protein